MKSCDECKLFINIGKMVKLKDSSGHHKVLCRECYVKMTKGEKKQYSYVEGKLDKAGLVSAGIMGFGIGGIAGAFGATSGVGSKKLSDNLLVKKSQKEHGYTEKEMDDFSIDVFDMHAGLLSNSQLKTVMDKLEGKPYSMF